MSLLDREYSEKRDFIRMKVNTPVQVIVQDDRIIEGVCHDLSGGGMLLTIREELALGQELVVIVDSKHGHSPMLHALCNVARLESGPRNTFLLGLEIQELLNQHTEMRAAE